jgi:hypothetical protein
VVVDDVAVGDVAVGEETDCEELSDNVFEEPRDFSEFKDSRKERDPDDFRRGVEELESFCVGCDFWPPFVIGRTEDTLNPCAGVDGVVAAGGGEVTAAAVSGTGAGAGDDTGDLAAL